MARLRAAYRTAGALRFYAAIRRAARWATFTNVARKPAGSTSGTPATAPGTRTGATSTPQIDRAPGTAWQDAWDRQARMRRPTYPRRVSMKAASKRGGLLMLAGILALAATALTVGYLMRCGSEAVGPASGIPPPPSMEESVSLTSRARAFHEAARKVTPPAPPSEGEDSDLALPLATLPPPMPPSPTLPPAMPPPPRPPSPDQIAHPILRSSTPRTPIGSKAP
jgi:hypothetical protein